MRIKIRYRKKVPSKARSKVESSYTKPVSPSKLQVQWSLFYNNFAKNTSSYCTAGKVRRVNLCPIQNGNVCISLEAVRYVSFPSRERSFRVPYCRQLPLFAMTALTHHDVSTLHGHGESAFRSDGGNTGGGSEGGGRREGIGRGGGDGNEKSGDLHCC